MTHRPALVGILIIVITLLYVGRKINYVRLTVNPVPVDATVEVVGQGSEKSRYVKDLPKGKYTVKVSKKGFKTKEETIDLQKETNLTVRLELEVELSDPNLKVNELLNGTPGQGAGATVVNSEITIAKDAKTRQLISITEKDTSVIYPKQVNTFDVEYPRVALLEHLTDNKIVMLNLKTNTVQTIDATSIKPVIDVGISEDLESLYILGKYNADDRTSVLYKSPLNNFKPEEIIKSYAINVEGITKDKALLFVFGESLDGSSVSLVDTTTKAFISTTVANSYKLSPSRKFVAVKTSSSLFIIDTETTQQQKLPAGEEMLVAWKDDETIVVLENTRPGVRLQYINVKTYKTGLPIKMVTLENETLKTLYGVSGNVLFARNAESQLLRIQLP